MCLYEERMTIDYEHETIDHEHETTLLHRVILHGQQAMAWHLIKDTCAPLDEPDDRGATPLMLAALKGFVSILQLLVRTGVNLSTKDKKGADVMVYAVVGGHIPVMLYLVEELGLDLKAKYTKDAYQLLHVAALHRNLKMIRMLLYLGADIHGMDSRGKDIAMYAARGGSVEVMSFLQSMGFDLGKKYGSRGHQLVHVAAYKNRVDLLRWFATCGVDFGARDCNGEGVAVYAVNGGSMQALSFLLGEMCIDVGLEYTSSRFQLLHFAAMRDNIKMMEYLVFHKRASVTAISTWGMPHHLAAFNDHLNSLIWLIAKGGAPTEGQGPSGMTALHVAAMRDSLTIFNWLVEDAHANLYAIGDDNVTPLQCAEVRDGVIMKYLKFKLQEGNVVGNDIVHWKGAGGHDVWYFAN